MSIRTKLLSLLLTTAIVSALVAGFAGYRSGSEALENEARQRLDAQRVSKAREISVYLGRLKTAAILNSRTETAIKAARDFTAGFEELRTQPVAPSDTGALQDYYNDLFLPDLAAGTGAEATMETYFPADPAAQYLQAKYATPFDSDDVEANYDAAIQVDDAGDGSAWSAAHRRYHDFFRTLTVRNGYEDTMLLDPEGNVIYTAYKGVDLGTNILTGPYASPTVTKAFNDVLRSNQVDIALVTDFETYAPSYDAPTAFDLSPIGQDGRLLGVLMVQLPVDEINKVMTNAGDWAGSGFGETGETFLVGPDRTLRSTARGLVEDPTSYEDDVTSAGLSAETAETIVRTGEPILRQVVEGGDVERAFRGQSGSFETPTFDGETVLSSFQPIDNPDLNWVIIAQVDKAEALGPQREFLRDLLLATLALIVLVTVAAVISARAFLRPVRTLQQGVRDVAEGELGTRVDLARSDEFGDLGRAFNDMTSSLAVKEDLLVAKRADNDRMLLAMMPSTVAQRVRAGESTIVEEHAEVSLVHVVLDGLDAVSRGRTSGKALEQVNGLLASFDEAAAVHGLAKVRSLRSGYLASSGLVEPAEDHAARAVAFAADVAARVREFNRSGGHTVTVRAGVASGPVTTGLIGRGTGYDLWGDPVDQARAVQDLSTEPGIRVTDDVRRRVEDEYDVAPAGDVDGPTGPVPAWSLTPKVVAR